MPFSNMTQDFSLKPFYGQEPIEVRASVQISKPQVLLVRFHLESQALTLPAFPPLKPVEERLRKDELWESTCFECFWTFDEQSYFELNLNPVGDWQIYSFTSERKGRQESSVFYIDSVQSEGENKYQLDFSIKGDGWESLKKINLTAILRSKSQAEFYAAQHLPKGPDFHNQKIWPEWSPRAK